MCSGWPVAAARLDGGDVHLDGRMASCRRELQTRWRTSSGILHRVVLVRTYFSEKDIASIFRVTGL
jgi:hypothetical protein